MDLLASLLSSSSEEWKIEREEPQQRSYECTYRVHRVVSFLPTWIREFPCFHSQTIFLWLLWRLGWSGTVDSSAALGLYSLVQTHPSPSLGPMPYFNFRLCKKALETRLDTHTLWSWGQRSTWPVVGEFWCSECPSYIMWYNCQIDNQP